MEFTAFDDKKISNISLNEGESVLTFDVEFEIGLVANIEITGIESISYAKDNQSQDITKLEFIESCNIDVTNIEENTFSMVSIHSVDGDKFILKVEMVGTILNQEDFENLIDNDEDFEEDEDGCCEGGCGGCNCGCGE